VLSKWRRREGPPLRRAVNLQEVEFGSVRRQVDQVPVDRWTGGVVNVKSAELSVPLRPDDLDF
jgi:hypothetical protein